MLETSDIREPEVDTGDSEPGFDALEQEVWDSYSQEWDKYFGNSSDPKNDYKRTLFALRRFQETFHAAESVAKEGDKGTFDKLTQLPNRVGFERDIQRIYNLIERGVPINLTLAIVDLDNFKSVNDTYGHPAGDEVLKAAAGALLTNLRNTDSVARLGGEEFVLLLVNPKPTPTNPDIQPLDPVEFTQRLGKKVTEAVAEKVDLRNGRRITNQTVSMGITTLVHDPNIIDPITRKPALSSPERLIKEADIALYHSKANGRNQVTQFTQGMTQPP